MLFKSLHLENFQVHEGLAIGFSPTISTIVGATDAGKSAVLRALQWVCTNHLSGDEFIREGTKDCTVTLKVSEDKQVFTIVRSKGRQNVYQLNDAEYKAFGTDVPQDIAALLRVSDINFQGQHDSPFWFNESAPEVSRRLNAVVDLSVIDSALSFVAGKVRYAQERVSLTEERLSNAKQELEHLEPQKQRVIQFRQIKEQHEELARQQQNRSRLANTVQRIRDVADSIQESQQRYEEGKQVLVCARALCDAQSRQDSLRAVLRDIERAQSKAVPPPDFSAVDAAFATWEEVHGEADSLHDMICRINNMQAKVQQREDEAREACQTFDQQTKGQKCPTCQRPF